MYSARVSPAVGECVPHSSVSLPIWILLTQSGLQILNGRDPVVQPVGLHP